MILLVQTGVRHAAETVAGVYRVSVVPAELTADLLGLETAAVAADLLCVVPVAELVVACLTSGTECLATVELLPEATACLLSTTTAALTDGLTDVVLLAVTAAATPLVLV